MRAELGAASARIAPARGGPQPGQARRGPAGTCGDQHGAAPRRATRPGRARGGREAAPGKPGRAAPHPPALPRPNLLERRRQWARAGSRRDRSGRAGREPGRGRGGLPPTTHTHTHTQRLVQPARSGPPPPSPARNRCLRSGSWDLSARCLVDGRRLHSPPSKSGACLQSQARERTTQPQEASLQRKAPGRLGQKREALT